MQFWKKDHNHVNTIFEFLIESIENFLIFKYLACFKKTNWLRRWQNENDGDVIGQLDDFLMVETMVAAITWWDLEVVEESVHTFLQQTAKHILI